MIGHGCREGGLPLLEDARFVSYLVGSTLVKYTHMDVGDDGASHFRDAEFAGPADGTDANVTLPLNASASNVGLARLPSQYEQDWHAESAILAVVVSGGIVITMTDGETRQFGAGDLVRVDDMNGRGHLLRGGAKETILLLVTLAG